MVKEDKVYITYKKNVIYNVGIRRFVGDNDGVILTNEIPSYRVEEDLLRDFKIANRRVITEGLIVEAEEESLDWDVSNAVTDEQVQDLLKNYAKLKSTLNTISSVPVVQKILIAANDKDASKRTISLIQARLDEITPEDETFIRKDDMESSRDG